MSRDIPLWSPKPDQSAPTFIAKLQERHGFDSYRQLHQWSITEIAKFWSDVWDDGEVIGQKGPQTFKAGNDFISSRFFADSYLNTAENLLAHATSSRAEEIAVIEVLEDESKRSITWKDLSNQVAKVAALMRSEGIEPGDRIAAWSPNLVEVLVFGLAGLSIGAVISTSSPDFAPSAVEDRFGQVEPKLLLVADSYTYGGKSFDLSLKIVEIARLLPTIKRIIVLGNFPKQSPSHAISWNDWINLSEVAPLTAYPKFPFDHPGFILFSSGTTGKPKCITHSAAGVLLKLITEHRYHFDINENDRVFFYSTCGWMMWNWMLYVLGTGASIVLYEGSPLFPTLDRLFQIADEQAVTVFGLSAKLIDSVRKSGLSPRNDHQLGRVRTVVSSGSVLSPEGFDFIYTDVTPDAHLVSMSGGTDICGCFLIGVPTLPVYRGELQAECLGMATDVFDQNGKTTSRDEKGELVCRMPFPSKPLGFWGDESDAKYKAAYFNGYPGIWTHGDFASKTEHGGYILYGRSDATLNSKGVRIGTAEIYRVVETFPEIGEAMAVSQDWDDDTRVILFVTLTKGFELTDDLRVRIKSSLRTEASPRHVPDLIIAAPALPRTKSNKLVELAVADVINGRVVRNRDALANPEALDWFNSLTELRPNA